MVVQGCTLSEKVGQWRTWRRSKTSSSHLPLILLGYLDCVSQNSSLDAFVGNFINNARNTNPHSAPQLPSRQQRTAPSPRTQRCIVARWRYQADWARPDSTYAKFRQGSTNTSGKTRKYAPRPSPTLHWRRNDSDKRGGGRQRLLKGYVRLRFFGMT